MDFSFEKTHSAYMLFYEHCQLDNEDRLPDQLSIPRDLQEQIWADNYQFQQDRLVFDPTYFNFIWAFCHHVPRTIERDMSFHSFKLTCSFVLETLTHSREKMNMKGWVDQLLYTLDSCQPACEWFLDQMAQDDWWIQQLMIKCPVQNIRQVILLFKYISHSVLVFDNMKNIDISTQY